MFVSDLCNPVVGVVSGHLAADVEALQDVEGSDQGHASVGGGGRHHVVSWTNTTRRVRSGEDCGPCVEEVQVKELQKVVSPTRLV